MSVGDAHARVNEKHPRELQEHVPYFDRSAVVIVRLLAKSLS